MSYTFTIKLTGEICDQCTEPLDDTPILLYRVPVDKDAVKAVASRGRTTFKPLTSEQVEEKADRLIAQEVTDGSGMAVFSFGDDYDGGPFEVDIVIAPVTNGEPGTEDAPQQVSLTTIQPRWRRADQGQVAAWDHAIGSRRWCAIKEARGIWTICGHVHVCEQDAKVPAPGVKVIAFDRDWLQDDEIGSGITDSSGHFRIDYTPTDFLPGTFIDVENPFWPWSPPSRPDVYFHVETPAGTPLLVESPSMGRTAGRNDVGACLCVDLCLDELPPNVPEYLSHFTHIGGINYSTQVSSTASGTGRTIGDDRAFHAAIRLNGLMSKQVNGAPAEYRIETRDLSGGSWTPVLAPQIAPTRIGTWQKVTLSPSFTIEEKAVIVRGTSGLSVIEVPVASDGWISVPQMTGAFTVNGHFEPNGNMVRLITTTLATWAELDMAAQVTGNSSVQPLAQNKHFGIRLMVRQQGLPATAQPAGECARLAIENTSYAHIVRHPSWMPQALPPQPAVCMVDIDQLIATGCGKITDALDVRFTAIHPNLGNVGLSMSGPGGPYTSWTMPGPGAGEHFGTATPNIVVADLDPCAYIVNLSVPILLTTGDSIPDPLQDQIAFTKE